ncbi:predicted protein [Chaetoceros tenuissimus]|uniref:Uncharacterized protein n=1 Tax=Chaetoceros tenuissimus TaxID=426638 RepID=A0AAD3D182_9STRA|nr:predicted protein [Chaetoceros tenuissimus]
MKPPHEHDTRTETGKLEEMKNSGPIKTISPKASLLNHVALLDRRTQMLLFGNGDISLSMEELCRAPRYRKRSFVRRNALNLSSRILQFSPCSSHEDMEKLDDQATSSTKSPDLLDQRPNQECSTAAHNNCWGNMSATQDFVDFHDNERTRKFQISSPIQTQSTVAPRKVSMLGASSEYSNIFQAKCCDLDVGFPRRNSFSSYSSNGEKYPSISNNIDDTNTIEQQLIRTDNRRRSLFNRAFNGFISQEDDKGTDSVEPDETQLKRRGSSLSIQHISQRLRRKSINCWTVDDTTSSSKDPNVSTSDSYNTDQNHRENNLSMVGEITKSFRRASLSILGKHQVSLRRISVDNTPLQKEELKNDNILLTSMKRVDTLNLLNVLNSQSEDDDDC